jgi:hypothetical protein
MGTLTKQSLIVPSHQKGFIWQQVRSPTSTLIGLGLNKQFMLRFHLRNALFDRK